MEISWFN